MNKRQSFLPRTLLLTILIIGLIFPTVMAEAEIPEIEQPQLTTEQANAFLESFFKDPDVQSMYQGAAVSIVKDGDIVIEAGYGFSDVHNEEKVNPDHTLFRIASVSKSLTAVAVMQLVEQGLLDLDEDIQTYLGDIQVENPFDQPVTLRHLLSHTSGFEIRDPQPTDFHDDFTLFVGIEDYIRATMPPVVREPGTAYMYGNFDSLLQGLIIQNVSGEPYEAYMENHIFAPLEMNDSGFLLTEDLLEQVAVGYDPAGEPLDPYTIVPTIMPHGGMLTTVADMSKFMIAFLDDESSDSTRILEKASIEEMSEYRVSSHDLLPNTTYGFESSRRLPGVGSSQHILTKAGDLTGYSSDIWLIPEENVGVFLTYNNNAPLRDMLFQGFIAHFFPQYAMPAGLDLYESEEAADLNRFVGYYQDLRLSTIVSTVKLASEGSLTLSNAFMGEFPLHQVDELLFMDDNGMLFGFVANEDGTIAYLDEPYLNPLGYAGKTVDAAGFGDIEAGHPYAEYIHALQSLGLYTNDAEELFEPERSVTRAEYITNLLRVSGLNGSNNPPAFTDVVDHPAAQDIQFAYEMGLIIGNGQGLFHPDRPITRQEMATIVWRSYVALFPSEQFADVSLSGETDEWAIDAVKMMVGLGIFGPEIELSADGSVDFLSKQPLLRQEEAAHHYKLLTSPILNVQ